jgi:Myristoyl-CoA:protein N-myristoyltransferase, N-terminal domain/Myristoyl-CoA:protein N-myristoyltransferase, C-terminal domain
MSKEVTKEQILTENKNSNSEVIAISEKKRESEFWINKPIMKSSKSIYRSSRIENLNEKMLYNGKNSHVLPDIMTWNIIQSSDDSSLEIVGQFLNLHFKQKNNINFSLDFLKFILGTDGFVLSIVTKNNNTLCGVVCVSIKRLIVFDRNQKFACTNFLCSHPRYRKKGLVKVLLNELSRYVNVEKNIQQGLFISDHKMLAPCSSIRRYYRPINYHKLVKCDFLKLDGKDNIIHNKFALSLAEESSKYIPMQKEHIDKVYELYNKNKSQYNMTVYYTQEELENLLLNNNIVKSYVILDDSHENVVDFVSYCHLQYRCKDDELINAGHIFLYSLIEEHGESMVNNLIKIMNKNNVDIVYTNDDKNIMSFILSEKYGNDEDSDIDTYEKVYEYKFLKQEKNYVYLFNWECQYLTTDRIDLGLIL